MSKRKRPEGGGGSAAPTIVVLSSGEDEDSDNDCVVTFQTTVVRIQLDFDVLGSKVAAIFMVLFTLVHYVALVQTPHNGRKRDKAARRRQGGSMGGDANTFAPLSSSLTCLSFYHSMRSPSDSNLFLLKGQGDVINLVDGTAVDLTVSPTASPKQVPTKPYLNLTVNCDSKRLASPLTGAKNGTPTGTSSSTRLEGGATCSATGIEWRGRWR